LNMVKKELEGLCDFSSFDVIVLGYDFHDFFNMETWDLIDDLFKLV
jgi:hypothetical protein